MVPISRQPKDKVQAIIESCMRQFPEFSDRARKRVRTYLKSCRRTRRHKVTPSTTTQQSSDTLTNGHKDSSCSTNSIEISLSSSSGTCLSSLSSNSSVYHLTSPIAEQILASACANESYNAKRMRAGLKPLPGRSISPSVRDSSNCDHFNNFSESQTINDNLGSILPSTTSPSSESAVQVLKPSASSSLNSTLLAALTGHSKVDHVDYNQSEVTEPLMLLNKKDDSPLRCDELENTGRQVNQSFPTINGNGSLSTPSSLAPLSTSSPSFHSSSPVPRPNIANGTTNCINSGGNQHSNSPQQQQGLTSNYLPYTYSLSPGETAAIKTLIAGYRESAAFLLRSANELEHLLIQQI
uniref:Nucleolar protein 4 helical domain-containing protein n=2 Tax=Tetranychus urticae TaxID=32264 RepID=T1K4X2_TETUR